MAYLTNLALAVTRTIDPKRLYDWMIAISKAVGGSPSIIGVGPFDTVARASSSRMLDVTVADLAAIENGAEVWVESFGGGIWVWRTDFPAATATDNESTCRPTDWIATGNDGAFVRELQGSRIGTGQAAWFVNSTATDNEGSGLSGDPLKTDVEIQRRWGVGVRAQLSNAITITYAQAPTNQSDYLFEIIPGGSLKFVGTPVVTKAGTVITAVQAQVRTAGAEAAWAITAVGLGASEVDKVPVITQSGTAANVGAYTIGLKDEGGGKLRVAPFGTFNPATGAFTQITPQVGDVIEIREMTLLQLGKIEGHNGQSQTAQNPTFGVTFDSVYLDSMAGATVAGALQSVGLGFYYTRCVGKILRIGGMSSQMPTQHFWRGAGFAAGGSITVHTAGILSCSQIGSGASIFARQGSQVVLSADCYFQNAGCGPGFPGGLIESSGAAFFDRTVSNQTILVATGGVWRQSGAVPDWGTANAAHGVLVNSAGVYVYTTKPTVNGTLGAGREAQVGGTDRLYATDVPYVEGANNAALVLTA